MTRACVLDAGVDGPDGLRAPGGEAGAASIGDADAGAPTGKDSTVAEVGVPDGSGRDWTTDSGDSGPGPGPGDASGEGGCGPVCSGTCTSGRCLLILASGLTTPRGIALNAPNVYFTDGTSGVFRVPMQGGAVSPLASGQDGPGAITVDTTYVYWANLTALLKMSQTGGPITTLASGQSPNEIAVDSTSIYWTDFNTVLRAPVNGGGPVTPWVSRSTTRTFTGRTTLREAPC